MRNTFLLNTFFGVLGSILVLFIFNIVQNEKMFLAGIQEQNTRFNWVLTGYEIVTRQPTEHAQWKQTRILQSLIFSKALLAGYGGPDATAQKQFLYFYIFVFLDFCIFRLLYFLIFVFFYFFIFLFFLFFYFLIFDFLIF
jgi:hypothetical protein